MTKKNKDPNQPKRKRSPLSEETKRKISLKRRQRAAEGNNPRKASQSNKRMSLAEELINEYSKKRGKSLREKQKNQEALEWLKNNKEELGYRDTADERIAIAKDWGVQTEYNEMHPQHYETNVGVVFYDEDSVDDKLDMNDPLNILLEKERNNEL
jgi:hypothetical protein